MNNSDRLKMGLRVLLISTPLLACCCPAMPIAHSQTDEVIQVSDQDLGHVRIDPQSAAEQRQYNKAQNNEIQRHHDKQDKSARPATSLTTSSASQLR